MRDKLETVALPRPASRLGSLRPYQRDPLAPGIDLRLDANEGSPPLGWLSAILDRIDGEMLCRYPDASALEGAVAQRWGVDPARVVVTAGGDEAIDRVCRAVLEPGRSALIHGPTFEMIERSALLAGAEVERVPWIAGPFPVARYVEAIGERTALAAVVTPNNPTGGVVPLDFLLEVARACAARGTLVLVDLAYAEFADCDPTAALLGLPNVVAVRTFSKAMGLAGLRVGYAIASETVASWLRTVGGPYPVSTISLAIAGAVLGDEEARTEHIALVRRERTRLTALLEERGVRVLDSQANFVLARFDDPAAVKGGLAERGIAVRGFSASSPVADSLRISLPGEEASFGRLASVLVEAMSPTGNGSLREAASMEDTP